MIILILFNNREELHLKQNIFYHIGSHKIILELLKNSILIFENYNDYFTNLEKQSNLSNIRGNMITTYNIPDKIINIYKTCFKILSYFCKDNPNYQKILASQFNLLIHNLYFNIGQIEFINELINNNIKVATQIIENLLNYICEMIEIHGKKYIFIDIIRKLVTYPKCNNIILQNKVLIHLLEENQLHHLNVTLL